jgi:hypothetical protein
MYTLHILGPASTRSWTRPSSQRFVVPCSASSRAYGAPVVLQLILKLCVYARTSIADLARLKYECDAHCIIRLTTRIYIMLTMTSNTLFTVCIHTNEKLIKRVGGANNWHVVSESWLAGW